VSIASGNGWIPVPVTAVPLSNLAGKPRAIYSDLNERHPNNLATSCAEIKSTLTMPLGIGPVPLPRFVNSLECHSWIDPNEFGLKTETSLSPAMVDVPAVIEDRIVQIEKNSLW